MTNRPRWFVLLVTLAVALAAACGSDEAAPSGGTGSAVAASTEERVASPFTHITVEGPIAVTVRQKSGAPERIEVTAPDGGHARVVTTVDDGAITVSIDGELLAGTSVLLVVAELETISASDGAAVELVGELDLPVFTATASSGASIVDGAVTNVRSGGVWQLNAEGASIVTLDALVVSAVTVEAKGDSSITVNALTSVLGNIEAGSTLEVAGDPARVEIDGDGLVRAMEAPAPDDRGAPPLVTRQDGLTGAPLPPPESEVVDFDEGRFLSNAGTFPALTDPAVVPASEATWLEGDTLVLGATQNGEARAYPIFQMTFHHVSNDVLGGKPYLVTF